MKQLTFQWLFYFPIKRLMRQWLLGSLCVYVIMWLVSISRKPLWAIGWYVQPCGGSKALKIVSWQSATKIPIVSTDPWIHLQVWYKHHNDGRTFIKCGEMLWHGVVPYGSPKTKMEPRTCRLWQQKSYRNLSWPEAWELVLVVISFRGYGCFLKGWYPQSPPQNDHFLVGKPMGLLGKPTILGNPHMKHRFFFVLFSLRTFQCEDSLVGRCEDCEDV